MGNEDPIQVKDGRLLGVFWVENDIFSNRRDISALAIALYCLLCRLADNTGRVAHNRNYLSKLSRISTGGVSKFAAELEKLGLIEINERRDGSKKLPTEYVVLSAKARGVEAPTSDGHGVTVTTRRSRGDGHQVTDKVEEQYQGGGKKEEEKQERKKEPQQGAANAQARLPGVEKADKNKGETPPETETERKARERLDRIQRERREAVTRVFAYFCERTDRNPKMYTLTPARLKVGLSRFQDCWNATDGDMAKAEELMRIAVDALAASEFHNGKNDRNRKYTDWTDHLFKSTDRMEKWLESDQ